MTDPATVGSSYLVPNRSETEASVFLSVFIAVEESVGTVDGELDSYAIGEQYSTGYFCEVGQAWIQDPARQSSRTRSRRQSLRSSLDGFRYLHSGIEDR